MSRAFSVYFANEKKQNPHVDPNGNQVFGVGVQYHLCDAFQHVIGSQVQYCHPQNRLTHLTRKSKPTRHKTAFAMDCAVIMSNHKKAQLRPSHPLCNQAKTRRKTTVSRSPHVKHTQSLWPQPRRPWNDSHLFCPASEYSAISRIPHYNHRLVPVSVGKWPSFACFEHIVRQPCFSRAALAPPIGRTKKSKKGRHRTSPGMTNRKTTRKHTPLLPSAPSPTSSTRMVVSGVPLVCSLALQQRANSLSLSLSRLSLPTPSQRGEQHPAGRPAALPAPPPH